MLKPTIRVPLVGALATLALALPLAAQEPRARPYGEAGDWGVYINPLHGDGCFARAMFSGGTEVRMGVDNLNGKSFIAAFNEAWDPEIFAGAEVPVNFRIDGKDHATAGTEVEAFGREGAVAFFDTEAELYDMGGRKRMDIFVDGKDMTAVLLEQAAPALAMVAECQAR